MAQNDLVIAPVIGRIVNFIPAKATMPAGAKFVDGQPLAGLICGFEKPGLLNLRVYDLVGNPWVRLKVKFVQAGEERPAGEYAIWPDFVLEQEQAYLAITSGQMAGAKR